jgi:hypothetical protein
MRGTHTLNACPFLFKETSAGTPKVFYRIGPLVRILMIHTLVIISLSLSY